LIIELAAEDPEVAEAEELVVVVDGGGIVL